MRLPWGTPAEGTANAERLAGTPAAAVNAERPAQSFAIPLAYFLVSCSPKPLNQKKACKLLGWKFHLGRTHVKTIPVFVLTRNNPSLAI